MGRAFDIHRVSAAVLSITVLLAGSAAPDYLSAKRKIELIRQDRMRPGSRVVLKESELNAYVRQEVAAVAPEGVKDPRLELDAGRATAYALVDFPKLRESQGKQMNWLLARMVAGERPVRVDARIQSGDGRATVDVERVEISGMTIQGAGLDYLIRNYLWSYFPTARPGEPFELAHGIERLEVRPSEVQVLIGR
jgi:hypothetical protein